MERDCGGREAINRRKLVEKKEQERGSTRIEQMSQ